MCALPYKYPKILGMLLKLMKLCEIMRSRAVLQASDSHLDLGRAPYDLYGVKYIDLVALW